MPSELTLIGSQNGEGLRALIAQTLTEMLSDPLQLPEPFRSWLPRYLEIDPPLLPISQITGFAQFVANIAAVTAGESASSTSFGDLATVGPKLTALPDGKYVVLFGAFSKANTVGTAMFAGVKVNATEALTTESAYWEQPTLTYGGGGVARGMTKSLSASGSNTLTMRYKTGGVAGTGTWEQRWLMALKYANL